MPEILMPALGADMESGVLVEWRIAPGDSVARGDIVAEVETDKGDIEIESYAEGVVLELVAEEGARVPVGGLLARLRDADGSAPAPEAPPARSPATPGARRAAAARGVDLASLTGSGPHGAVTEADVERAAAAAGAAAPPPAPDPTAALRRATGELMARSKREIPHYYLEHRIDASRVTAHIATLNEGRPPTTRLVLTPFLMRAIALAAREVPEVNGHWRDGGFIPSDEVHVGLAISLRSGGVVAPVVSDVHLVRAEDLMAGVRDLVRRARSGVMRSGDVAPATITLSALGERSVELVHGVIHPPQVALVGAGSVLSRPWAVDGRVEVRPVLALTLAGDHRVSDGRRGGRFLQAVERLLEKPEEL